MTLHASLLERMASVSPGVRAHLGGELWQQQISEDEISSQTLVLECFSVLIDESYEIGLEFFCARSDLCDSMYHLDLTLLLFEAIYPTPLYRSISEIEGFKLWITATVQDGGGDPDNTTIQNILEYLALDYPDANNTFYDTYVFLQDKLTSTPVFDAYVLSILATDTIPFEAPVDSEMLQSYLEYVQKHTSWLLKAVDYTYANSSYTGLHADIQLQYNRLGIYKNNATTADTLANYAWMFQQQQSPTESINPVEQALVIRFTREFESNTPLYEEYFRLRGTYLSQADILSLMLGCMKEDSTKESFISNVDATFQRLKDLLTTDATSLQLFITGRCLELAREFYK